MLGLLQRVSQAQVVIAGETVASIERGLLVLVAVEREDDAPDAERLVEKLLSYRVFADAKGKMNRSVRDVGGGVLLVPQFTLAADTRKGLRPSFSGAAAPDAARALFAMAVEIASRLHSPLQAGRFGADMQVGLINDGPVTFMLQS